MTKRFTAIAMAVLIALSLFMPVCALAFGRYSEFEFTLSSDYTSNYEPEKLIAGEYGKSYYEQLDDLEKTIYDARQKSLKKLLSDPSIEKITIDMPSGCTVDQFASAFFLAVYAFDMDKPEVFWLSKSMRVGYSYNSANIVVSGYFLKPETGWYASYSTSSEVKSAISKFNKALDNVIDEAYPGIYEKILFFHDYLVNRNEYNRYVASGNEEKASELAWTAASALICDSKAESPVCEGYSRAFKALCDKAGITCAIVCGYGSGENHMWNYVKMPDGEWYGVDVTWDDPVSDKPKLSHSYFLKGSATFLKNHVENGGFTGYGEYSFPELSVLDYVFDPIKGDANLDGFVNSGDAAFVLQFCAGKFDISSTSQQCADFNSDKKVNTGDAAAILRYITL